MGTHYTDIRSCMMGLAKNLREGIMSVCFLYDKIKHYHLQEHVA